MDTVSPEHRSWIMSRIRSTGTLPEQMLAVLVRDTLSTEFRGRIRTVRNAKSVFGTPDIYVPKLRLAIFVDGCFFHGCDKHCRLPKSNTDFWAAKIQRNRRRDLKTSRRLRTEGISVWRFWEHDVRPSPNNSMRLRLATAVRRAMIRSGVCQPQKHSLISGTTRNKFPGSRGSNGL